MKRFQKIVTLLVCLLLLSTAFFVVSCKKEEEKEVPHVPVSMDAESCKIVVTGYEWGPAVSGLVVKFKGNVSNVSKDVFTVKTANAARTVTEVYVCDENGKKVNSGNCVYIGLSVEYNSMQQSAVGSPFTYDWMTTQKNTWTASYPVALTVAEGKSFTAGDTTYQANDKYNYTVSSAADRIVPQTATWVKDTYSYTEGSKNITLQRAAWTPVGAKDDGVKNPLIIWLHGAGEGGADIDIALLGNEVTALTSDNDVNVQSYFKNGSAGAYVLALQTPTIWMDSDGNGTYNHKDETTTEPQQSYYTEALWGAITSYVQANPDIDVSRIYLGGCSNGGYMTMNMMFEHGDYFAAFYPVCEAYLDQRISDAMIEKVKDYNIWFVQSFNDPTVDPPKYGLPTFQRLIKAGAKNVHLTLTEKVLGKDKADTEYNGHWSWIYVFNDDVKTEFDNAKVSGVDYLTPANCNVSANMWKWVSEQSKTAVKTVDYALEAESAVITDGKGTGYDQTYQPIEVDVKPTVETYGEVTNVGNFFGSATIKWTITVSKECDVTLTLHAASAVSSFDMTTFSSVVSSVDLSKNEYLKVKVNSDYVTLNGVLPSTAIAQDWSNAAEAYHNFGTATVTVHLNAGENVIVLEGANASAGVNIDKVVLSSPYEITYVATDNSSRVQSQG